MFLQCFFKRNHFYRNTSICMPCYQCSSSLRMPIHYPFIAKIIYRHSICQLDTFIHKRQRIKMVMSTKHPFYNTIIHCSVKKSALKFWNPEMVISFTYIAMLIYNCFISHFHFFIGLFELIYRNMEKCHRSDITILFF